MSAVVLIDRLQAARPSPTPHRRVGRAAGMGRPAQAQELLVGLDGVPPRERGRISTASALEEGPQPPEVARERGRVGQIP
jgi:hypothetical protein